MVKQLWRFVCSVFVLFDSDHGRSRDGLSGADRKTGLRLSQRGLVLMVVAGLGLASMAVSQDTAWDPYVHRRVAVMNDANAVMKRLNDMAGARAIFHRERARLDRKALIRFTKSIPKMFRKPRMDLHSRARPDIWENPVLFRVRARIALSAARGINFRSQDQLRATLPYMLQACLDCHQQFRKPP